MRELMDGYVGIKYEARCLSEDMEGELADALALMDAEGRRLAERDMAPANGGNMSLRLVEGFLVTASGSNLGRLAPPGEVVQVVRCDVEAGVVWYRGAREPSSEALMHHLVLEARPEAGAVVHAHDPATSRETMVSGGLVETAREEPYGTIALAERAMEAFTRARRLIVLRNHGYVSVGADLTEATDLVVETHDLLTGRNTRGPNRL